MTNYNEIPEGASDEIIIKYIKQFIIEAENIVSEKGIIYALEQLQNICEHGTINGYSDECIVEISNFIKKYLNYTNPELMDVLLTIVISMHLETIWYEIINPTNFCDEKVKELIDDAIAENEEYKYFNKEEHNEDR